MVSLSNSASNGAITVNMVQYSMFNEEIRRKELGISSNTKTLIIERQGKSKSIKPSSYYNCDKSRGKSKSRKELKCFYYGKLRHIKIECGKFRRERFKGKCEE